MKLNEKQLRNIIRTETGKLLSESKKNNKYSLRRLFEAEGELASEKTSGGDSGATLAGKPLGAPQGESFTDQTSFGDFTNAESCRELFAQLGSGDSNQPIYQAISSAGGDPKKVEAWFKSKGPEYDALADSIVSIGSKLPASGPPKKMMPFLPGPKDAKGSISQVEDALTPGGELNVDFKESRRRLTRNSTVLVERWQKLAGLLKEEVPPPEPNTFIGMDSEEAKEYMTSGLNDGKPADDNTVFQLNPTMTASDAIPTQKNILLAKSLGMAAAGIKGGPLGAYFSTKGEILDGHHRWSATMLNDPNAQIGGFAAIDLEAMGGREKALKHLTAIGNALGNETKLN